MESGRLGRGYTDRIRLGVSGPARFLSGGDAACIPGQSLCRQPAAIGMGTEAGAPPGVQEDSVQDRTCSRWLAMVCSPGGSVRCCRKGVTPPGC